MKKELILRGLDCANCAAKIENGVKKIEGIKEASVDFISKKLIIETENRNDLEKIINAVSEVAVKIEPHIEIVDNDSHENIDEEDEAISTAELIRLGVGAILFLVAIVFNFTFWIELGIFLTSYILVGGEVVKRAAKNIIRGQVFDENFLMTIATMGAFAIKQFPEGVAVMLFYNIGELFQKLAVDHSRKSISSLMNIRPDYANLKDGAEVIKVSPNQVKKGDIIIIKPGEKIPLDGKVIEGSSMLDTSAITGESIPKEVTVGDEIFSGSINKNGLLTVQVSKEFEESTVSKILNLVQNASHKKASTEKFITKFARYYTPAVVSIAFMIAIIPPMLVPGTTFSQWIYRALIFLVVSCPCALVISIPLGFFGGIGGASKNGILMKGSNYLEALNNIDTVVFDKTGTLTEGIFQVTKIQDFTEEQNLPELAAYAECYSNHPIALSIIKEYGKEIDKSLIESHEEISGYGIKVKVKEKEILAGNFKLMNKEAIKFSQVDELGSVVHIAVDGRYAGYIVIADKVKKDAKDTILKLKEMGIKRIVMLTGDSADIGSKIGEQLGIDEVYAELLPHEKIEKLEMLENQKTSKGKLIFVGDGINDAPVLSRVDVGVAMGGLGADAAIEAADIVIMNDEPSKLVSAIKIARVTKRIVWQNIIFAFVVKGLILFLGAGGLATMWEAVFADIGVALIAIFNAMRVLNVKNI